MTGVCQVRRDGGAHVIPLGAKGCVVVGCDYKLPGEKPQPPDPLEEA